jgi:hypothetical protein
MEIAHPSPSSQQFCPISYERHRPEETLLYKVIQENIETFLANIDREPTPKGLPKYVKEEFYKFLRCGLLQYGFLRVKCQSCTHEKITAFSCKGRGFCPSCGGKRMAETAAWLTDAVIPNVAVRQWVLSLPIPMRYLVATHPRIQSALLEITIRVISTFLKKKTHNTTYQTGTVTVIQRFGSALNLTPHFHMLFLDGIYSIKDGMAEFHKAEEPTDEEVKEILSKIARRSLKYLVKKGYFSLEEDCFSMGEDPFVEREPALAELLFASSRYRIATGERKGQKIRKLGALTEAFYEEPELKGTRCANLKGFSLHANTSIPEDAPERLEKICSYILRPPIATQRLSQRRDGELVYQLKKIYDDGTDRILFSPLEFIEKLSALVPPPKHHLVRYHGILAPHSKFRPLVVPNKVTEEEKKDDPSPSSPPDTPSPDTGTKTKRLTWAQLLQRVFDIDIRHCPQCGGEMKAIAAITEKAIIEKILTHLGLPTEPPTLTPARAPPQQEFSHFIT